MKPTPLVPMPETPVHEYARSVSPEHNVGFPRQPPMVQPVAESSAPQKPSHNNLRLRILGTNGSHVAMALVGCVAVGHGNGGK